MNKIVYVTSFFKPNYKTVTKKVPTGETRRGRFGESEEIYREETIEEFDCWSDSMIDGERLNTDIAKAVEELNSKGYEVVSVMPVTSGAYHWEWKTEGIQSSPRIFSNTEKITGGANYSYGYGYSYTEGVTIIARLCK